MYQNISYEDNGFIFDLIFPFIEMDREINVGINPSYANYLFNNALKNNDVCIPHELLLTVYIASDSVLRKIENRIEIGDLEDAEFYFSAINEPISHKIINLGDISFNECISNNNYIAIRVSYFNRTAEETIDGKIAIRRWEHQSVILINQDKEEIEFFEPGLTSEDLIISYIEKLSDYLIKNVFNTFIEVGYIFIKPTSLCGIGPQIIEQLEGYPSTMKGFCFWWSLWYVYHRLGYSDIPRDQFIKKYIGTGYVIARSPQEMFEMINKFRRLMIIETSEEFIKKYIHFGGPSFFDTLADSDILNICHRLPDNLKSKFTIIYKRARELCARNEYIDIYYSLYEELMEIGELMFFKPINQFVSVNLAELRNIDYICIKQHGEDDIFPNMKKDEIFKKYFLPLSEDNFNLIIFSIFEKGFSI